jgi:tRNA (adenine22-N1)-methyltransferase
MNSFKVGEELSLRLSTIRSFYSQETHIWDIGCDHGLLGTSLIDSGVKSVNLVDASAAVVDTLLKKYKDSYITETALNILHSEGQKLNLVQDSNCIFIAGMGGKEIGEIILNLLPQLNQSSRIVISPHRKILELRCLLKELPVTLYRETLVFEDGQYYQILALTPGSKGPKVSSYGEQIWEGDVGELYLEQQLKHFSTHRDARSVGYCDYLRARKQLKLAPKLKA